MSEQTPQIHWETVHPLPRPIHDWKSQILEYLFLLGITLWLGAHASSALLVAPLVTKITQPSLEMARLLIGLIEILGYVATLASAVLLFTTVGMHMTELRERRTILIQLSLILVMTVIAILPMLVILPKLSSMLRTAALTSEGLPTDAGAVLFGAVSGLGLMGLLHLFFGAILVTFGVRRCYRYV
jgi:hypothetical protein